MGVMFVYQLAYQTIMMKSLRKVEDDDGVCVLTGSDDGVTTSPRCKEVQLFHTWRKESESEAVLDDDEETLVELASSEEADTTIAPTLSPSKADSIVVASDGKTAEEKWSPMTEWGSGLVALQAETQEKMQHLHSVVAKHAQEHQAEMDALEESTRHALESEPTTSQWSRDLQKLQADLEARMERLPSAHPHPPHHEILLVDKINNLARELCEDPHRRDRPACAQFVETLHPAAVPHLPTAEEHLKKIAASHEGHDSWEHDFQDKGWSFINSLCSEPQRRGTPVCTQLLSRTESKEAAEHDAAPSEVAPSEVAPHGLRGAPPVHLNQLHWSKVKTWSSKPARRLRSSAQPSMESANYTELRHAHWEGAIPTVACITVVPSTHDVHARMKYFINNFHLQSYEGLRQLVLVYHHADKEIGKLVKLYADGVFIKALATRGTGEYPSTQSYRYGAWMATDADVIARWEFNAWHHPQRLTMQVRALAMTERPASLFLQKNSTSGKIEHDDMESVVGEVAWMRANWHPLIETEHSLLEGARGQVVQVDAPTITGVLSHETAHEKAVPAAPAASAVAAEPKVTDSAAAVVEGVAACRELEDNKMSPGSRLLSMASREGSLMAVIGAKAGHEMMEAFQALADRRRDVFQNFWDLCEEDKKITDPAEKKSLEMHVGRIAILRKELDEHFHSVETLFSESPSTFG
jgi:hypothetical protein